MENVGTSRQMYSRLLLRSVIIVLRIVPEESSSYEHQGLANCPTDRLTAIASSQESSVV